MKAFLAQTKVLALEKAANARHAFTSWPAFKEWVQVPDDSLDGDGEKTSGPTWSNEDLLPTPIEKRTWRWWNFAAFYVALGFGNWTLGSTMIGIGLNWWQAILTIFISQLISSIVMLFNSRCASVYHIGYPVVARSVFGMWGSYYYVGVRALLAIIWFSVQLYSGSALLGNMLRAIFGHNYTDIPNGIPKSEGITSAGMLAFFLYWLCHLPFTVLRPYQLRWFFNLKVVIMIPAVFGLFIFCMANTHGHIGLGHLQASKAASGGWGWFFVYSINSGMGNTATLITNQPDIARWSKTKTGALWSQLVANPITVTLSASLGILSTAAINNAWGLQVWNQWDLLDEIMTRYWSGTTRFAIVLAAFAWAVSILGTNIAANMIPFGSDSSMLFPRFLNIPRGQFLVLLLGFAVCPWKILASASTFTTFLSGYGLFMASVVAIMVCDYFLLTRGNVFISHCYDGSSKNRHYYYNLGWNLQAVIAYLCGIALPFPGFVGTLGPHVSVPAQRLGHLGWLLSFFVSFFVYWAICLVWPTKNQKMVKEAGLGWEEMSERDSLTLDGAVIVNDATRRLLLLSPPAGPPLSCFRPYLRHGGHASDEAHPVDAIGEAMSDRYL
ncbi:uracil permease-like protein [Polychaeton citri CBS 116435]|uniref:Uracil permease-like protein n=1 Tax=Polychaeton citri CBS 116435 TaxID=1314669 RepID=A0A9P4Q428_9PEZI|nr:uracil permease-like protein [Polychaeton citri CBS 116435]